MNTRAWKWVGVSGLWTLAVALLAGACGGTTANSPGLGSESHFLARCAGSCEGGLDCIGGICTRACLTASSSCTDLAPSASCTDQSVEPGEVAVCDVGCSLDGDCQALGSGYVCASSFCRRRDDSDPTSVPEQEPSELSCELYADQSPPPDVRGISIVNRTSSVLYLQQFGGCGVDNVYSVVQVLRDGREINVSGGGCGVSCQESLSTGLTRTDHYPCGPGRCVGELSPDCPGANCAAPSRVAIQPGETLFQPAQLEAVFRRMPAGCVTAPLPASLPELVGVNCFTKVIPSRGNYTLQVAVFTEPECTAGPGAACPGPILISQPSEWYYDNQTFELTLP